MAFEFCWEHRGCTRECRVRDLRVLFCWRAQVGEGHKLQEECDACSYRQRWVKGELSTADFPAHLDRRAQRRTTRRVLVVDDEPNILYALKETVRELGFDCIGACDGEEALIIARGARPDLIITDVIMPKLNGYQLCETLKGDAATNMIPIVMVTVRSTELDRKQGAAVGANAYIVKPFHVTDIKEVIDRLLPQQP